MTRPAALVTVYICTVVYCCGIIYAYEKLSHFWHYFGFYYNIKGHSVIYAFSITAAMPSVLLSKRVSTLADFSAWILYFIIFLPCALVPVMQNASIEKSLPTHLLLLISSVVFILCCRVQIINVRAPRISSRNFWIFYLALYAIFLIPVLVTFQGSLNLVSFDDVYDQRYFGASQSNVFTSYAVPILSDAMNPFLIAAGLATRRRAMVFAGAASQLLLFATFAMRSTILSPILIVGAWHLFSSKGELSGARLAGALAGVVIAFLPLMVNYDNDGLHGAVATLLYMRTLLISGVTFGVYDTFFSIYPNTFLSHMFLGRLFSDYPYGELQIGQVVGQFLAPSTGMYSVNYNAHFLATDGLAGFGRAGIIPAAAILGLVLSGLGQFLASERTRMAAAASVPFLINLANVSLFTSLLTGGGALLTLLLIMSDEMVHSAQSKTPK